MSLETAIEELTTELRSYHQTARGLLAAMQTAAPTAPAPVAEAKPAKPKAEKPAAEPAPEPASDSEPVPPAESAVNRGAEIAKITAFVTNKWGELQASDPDRAIGKAAVDASKAAFTAIRTEFGVEKIADLPTEKLGDFLRACTERL